MSAARWPPASRHRGDERRHRIDALLAQERRMLQLGIDAAPVLLRQRQHFGEGRDLVLVVVLRVGGAQLRDALARAQRLQLGEREILHPPAGRFDAIDRLRLAAIGEFRRVGDIGRAARFRSRGGTRARRPSSSPDRAR